MGWVWGYRTPIMYNLSARHTDDVQSPKPCWVEGLVTDGTQVVAAVPVQVQKRG